MDHLRRMETVIRYQHHTFCNADRTKPPGKSYGCICIRMMYEEANAVSATGISMPEITQSSMTYNCLSDKQRLEDIFEVCAYFPEKGAKINDFERKFMRQIYQQQFISEKQNSILCKIEMKVFGVERHLERSKNVLR